jgi:hypothetical protein
VRRWLALCAVLSGIVLPSVAVAQDPPPEATPPPADTTAPPNQERQEVPPLVGGEAHIDIAPQPPEPKVTEQATDQTPEGIAEAPPPRPRRKGVVVESTLGVLGFAGRFRHVAPPAYWLHLQLGYDVTDWLMFFGEGELGFTDTSVAQTASQNQAFPLFAFGGGARATLHFTPRFAAFVQGDIDAISANVPHNALTFLGFRNAEALSPSFGGRLGIVWYQVDRHLALTAQGGLRDATGFAKTSGPSDLPLMWDGAVGLNYTF